MRVCVFGAGSLGSAVGGMLAASNEVTLIGRNPHMSAVSRHGLVLSGDVRKRVRVKARCDIHGLEPPEMIVVTTKAYDTKEVVNTCAPWADEHTRVLTLQNGLGNLEILRAWKGRNVFGGTTTMGARLISPGRVRVSGLGRTVIGADLDGAFAMELAGNFAGCGMPAQVVEDIRTEIWSKAAVSASINPLTAILRVSNGVLCESEAVARLVSEICAECAEIAKAEGVRLTPGLLEKRVWTVARNTSKNRSSMLLDVEMGRRTEVEQINGAFLEAATGHGLSAPVNRALTAMVSVLDGKGTLGKV